MNPTPPGAWGSRLPAAAVRVRIGRTCVPVDAVGVGRDLPLGTSSADGVEVYVAGRRIARGQIVDVNGKLGVRVRQVFAEKSGPDGALS